jgi:hypothetical protein
LSSGEAEFYGAVKASGYGLAYQALLQDLGSDRKLAVYTDSTAAIGIASRQGLGKLRHLDTLTLWLQQAVRCKKVTLRKVAGEDNPADVFTKHLPTSEKLGSIMKLFDCKFLGGRAEAAPQLRREERPRTEMKDIDEEHGEINVLPHLHGGDLDQLYPQLEAADDWDTFDEACMYYPDYLERHGLKMAADISAQAAIEGRKRRVGV